MKMDMNGMIFYGICIRSDAFNLKSFLLYIIIVITLTTTSTLQNNIKETSATEDVPLPKAFNQNDKKSDEKHLIRYMSDDMQIQEPNAIYLQCVVPQHLHVKPKDKIKEGVYTITWARELTSSDGYNIGKVQILSRNGRVSRHRTGKTALDRISSARNRIRSWIAETTKGDEHVLMVRDTNRSLDEGIYSCQIHLNDHLVETQKSKITFEEGDYYDNYHDPMISNPTMFGSQRSPSPSENNPQVVNTGDGSNAVAQNAKDSNPVTAKFVIAKRGMNVVLECHDHDVRTVSQDTDANTNAQGVGSTKATVKNNQNYVWRKEGDSKNIIGHGKKLKLVKVDRWDNGVYFCSANIHAKDSESDEDSSGKRKTSFHLQVAAPKVSSNSPPIKDLGLDEKSLETLKKSLKPTSTISSTLHITKSGILGRKDAMHKNSLLHQHAMFGKLGDSISLSCMAEGEPIPNVRWYVDKTIEEEVFQDKDEKLEIMKFSESDKKTVSYSLDSQQMQFSPSSIPTINEATFSTDTYAVDDGRVKETSSDQPRSVFVQSIRREEIKSGEEYAITINGYRDGGFESILKIHDLKPHHFSKYYCEAQNNRGDDGLVIHLLEETRQHRMIDLTSENSAAMIFNGHFKSKLILQVLPVVLILYRLSL